MGKPFNISQQLYLYFFIAFVIVLTSLSTIPVAALTGSIGNARMILRVEAGDVIEKCVLVKNVNDQEVQIEVSASGELAQDIIFKEKDFIISAHEEKNACFTLPIKKEGTSETKILVAFNSLGEGSGIGLSSTVIVIAKENRGFFDGLFGNDEESDEENSIDINYDETNSDALFFKGISLKIIFVSLSTITLTVILIGLLFFYKKKNVLHITTSHESIKQKKERKIKDE